MALIGCVPNVSEGRRAHVVAALSDAARAVPGLRLLDVSSDPSHNRSVLSMAGEAHVIEAAVIALFRVAARSIDLRAHSGVHPRIGAIDVVPVVPIVGATMDDCVALARSTARQVAQQFHVPVYLYEAAATSPSRRNLAEIRRGQFEGLARKMATPEWHPDFGPPRPHPALGATAIGARGPLIAYNVNLATGDLGVAKRVAAAVRESSGGLASVKALGLALEERGIVQVSMNLTDYVTTSMTTAFDAVTREARRLGVEVLESEIVGLVPAAAVPPGARDRLRLRESIDDHVLEARLREAG